MVIEMRTGQTHPAPAPPLTARWWQLDMLSASARYRRISNTASGLQDQITARGRLRLDAAGRLSIGAGLSTGDGFTSGWNNTGAGTGDVQRRVFLKHFDATWRAASGIRFELGRLDIARGQSTEITSYDNDGTLVGGRFRVERPQDLFFDEISYTQGHLRDLRHAGYIQGLVRKRFARRFNLSSDVTSELGELTFRQGARVDAAELRIVDVVHVEHATSAAFDWAAYAEKRLERSWTIGGGLSRHARRGLYSDRFGVGRYAFANVHWSFRRDWSLMFLATRGGSRTRVDIAIGYNALTGLGNIRRVLSHKNGR